MNYRRFYGALNRLDYVGDREDLKVQLVLDYTGGRTPHLHEMREEEYKELCTHLEAKVKLTESAKILREQLKKKRGMCLFLMNEYGVNTADWDAVDKFCLKAKIAGKRFAWLKISELDKLARKMRAILEKGQESIVKSRWTRVEV